MTVTPKNPLNCKMAPTECAQASAFPHDFANSWFPNVINMSCNYASELSMSERFCGNRALDTQEQLAHEQNPAQFFTRQFFPEPEQ